MFTNIEKRIRKFYWNLRVNQMKRAYNANIEIYSTGFITGEKTYRVTSGNQEYLFLIGDDYLDMFDKDGNQIEWCYEWAREMIIAMFKAGYAYKEV